jgi:RNA recognition motif-containing protein
MKTTTGQELDAPMKIFVGGLTEHLADITEMDIRNIFPFGDIDYIDLHKNPSTGKSQGYAFIQFRKSSQARAAISAMNGFEYMGKILKVGPAEGANKHGNEMLLPSNENDDEGNTAVLHNIQSRQTLMQKLNRDTNIPQYDNNFPSIMSGTNQLIYGGLMPNMYQNQQKPQNFNVPGKIFYYFYFKIFI